MATDTTPPPVNPSPKTRFLSAKNAVQEHRALLDRPAMQFGLDFALLEYQRVLCESRGDMSMAAANHYKMAGAQEFVHVLRTLSETPRIPTATPTGNLQHQ